MAVRTTSRRRRALLTGVLLILLGAWGGVVPFIGPYFKYAYTPDTAWSYTSDRLWLSVVPGAAAVLGGLVVLASPRAVAMLGACLAALGGAWFAVGRVVGPAWVSLTPGTPVGDAGMRALEEIGFFTGLGLVIVLAAMVAFGRLSVAGAFDLEVAAEPEPHTPDAESANSGATTG
jgi:hypothetical protein